MKAEEKEQGNVEKTEFASVMSAKARFSDAETLKQFINVVNRKEESSFADRNILSMLSIFYK